MGILSKIINKISGEDLLEKYVIFDFETNGLNPKTNRVIEIGALKIVNNQIVEKFETLVNPQKNITKKITEINGISNEMLIDAPLEKDAFGDFYKFILRFPLTAYNINFDLGFLDETFKRLGLVLYNFGSFDSLKAAKHIFPNLCNYKLETVMRHITPDYQQQHRALADCYAVKEILNHIELKQKHLNLFG